MNELLCNGPRKMFPFLGPTIASKSTRLCTGVNEYFYLSIIKVQRNRYSFHNDSDKIYFAILESRANTKSFR